MNQFGIIQIIQHISPSIDREQHLKSIICIICMYCGVQRVSSESMRLLYLLFFNLCCSVMVPDVLSKKHQDVN